MHLPDVNFWLALAFESHAHHAFSTNVWTDAYLAAFAQSADFELVSFDRGFVQYRSLRQTLLS